MSSAAAAAAAANYQHHATVRLPLSLSIIFGSFTLGFYIAIQGPTLMDLIDILHVNNDIMSHSLAFGSLAYSVGGLLSGFLFNYVDRQMLIPAYYVVFGLANIVTPYIQNYYIFSVLTVFKMMCAGGTDCGANVWILDMWPGKDAWLQALHFSFAIGTALGPLVVEPFLSVGEHKDEGTGGLSFNDRGTAVINSENGDSRIYIPYAVSGSLSLLAAFFIVYLYFVERRHKRQAAADAAHQLLAPLGGGGGGGGGGKQSSEHILMSAVQHPAAIEAGLALVSVPETIPEEVPLNPHALSQVIATSPEAAAAAATTTTTTTQTTTMTAITTSSPQSTKPQAHQSTNNNQPQSQSQTQSLNQTANTSATNAPSRRSSTASLSKQQQQQQQQQLDGRSTHGASQQDLSQAICVPNHHQVHSRQLTVIRGKQSIQLADWDKIKFTSKAREQEAGRPPYYVMLAIALSAMCLSFYCGIEITSMNYLATFAVNLDTPLSKSAAALISSALTISFAVGRLFGIWIAVYMAPHRLFYLCATIMALGNVFILLFASTQSYLWFSICLFGIGCGPMYASIVSFYDDKIAKVTNTVSGIFILGSMFNVALNTLIIGHQIIDHALILIHCNLIGAVLLLMLFGSLHLLTKVKKNNRKRKFKLAQARVMGAMKQRQEQQQQQRKLECEQQVALMPRESAAEGQAAGVAANVPAAAASHLDEVLADGGQTSGGAGPP